MSEKSPTKLDQIRYHIRGTLTVEEATALLGEQSRYNNRAITMIRQQGVKSGQVRTTYYSSHFGKNSRERLVVYKSLIAPNLLSTSIQGITNNS